MKICMVVFTDLPFDFRVFRQAKSLQEAGHDVCILSSRFRDEPLPAVWAPIDVRFIDVDRTQSLRISYPRFWRQATAMARHERADVYHAHDLDALWPAARAARAHTAHLVYDSHELFCEQSAVVSRRAIRFIWRRLERRLIGDADRVITVAPTIASQLQQTYRLRETPRVIRNVPPYQAPVPGNALRQRLSLPAGTPVVLYQGGFLTDNGLVEQIDMMQHVRDAHLVLLGSGPTESLLRDRIAARQLGGRIHIVPRVPFAQLHEITCSADVGLCIIKPTGRSFAWSLPNKLFEYMMAGLPVVGGDTPEIRRVIEQTGAGLVVDALDPVAMAAGLNEVLGDPARRAAMATAARAAAHQNNWDTEARCLIELYETL